MLAAMYNLAIWAQINKGRQPGGGISQAEADGILATIFASLAVFGTILAIITVFAVIVQWKIFTKAGEPGWAALVPIYNFMILSKICGRGEAFGLLLLVPCVGQVIAIMLIFDLAKVFGKSGGFAVGMLFLGIIFYPILAFGSAEYIGADGKSPGRKRGRDDDDDEEEEERPRRPAGKDPRTQQRPSAPPPAAPKRRPPADDDDEEEERPRPRNR